MSLTIRRVFVTVSNLCSLDIRVSLKLSTASSKLEIFLVIQSRFIINYPSNINNMPFTRTHIIYLA